MPLVTHALTTLANVKLMLGITDSSKDSLLELLINSCTDWIESYCGRRFKAPSSAVVELIDCGYQSILILRDYPITTFTKLEERISQTDFEIIDSDDYLVDTANGRIILSFETQAGVGQYRAEYIGGFSTIPNDLSMACTQLVINEYNDRAGGGEIRSESLGEYSVTYTVGDTAGTEADRFIDQTLNKYKRVKV